MACRSHRVRGGSGIISIGSLGRRRYGYGPHVGNRPLQGGGRSSWSIRLPSRPYGSLAAGNCTRTCPGSFASWKTRRSATSSPCTVSRVRCSWVPSHISTWCSTARTRARRWWGYSSARSWAATLARCRSRNLSARSVPRRSSPSTPIAGNGQSRRGSGLVSARLVLCEELALRRALPSPIAEHFEHRGEDRDDDDGQDHQLEVLLDDRLAAELPAGHQEEEHPGHSARDIEEREPCIAHSADTGDKRGEGTDDRYEARQDDRLAAVSLVKLLGLDQVLLV